MQIDRTMERWAEWLVERWASAPSPQREATSGGGSSTQGVGLVSKHSTYHLLQQEATGSFDRGGDGAGGEGGLTPPTSRPTDGPDLKIKTWLRLL